ncbi:MAG: DUF1684 domain-containing protein [Candidatus Thermofonsia bacterium]|nr:MAG: DUF1684 domain-containing protein [Candidatus Thermofonsia bacterium]
MDTKTLLEFRRQINLFMKHHKQSPLSRQQKANFSGLTYYEPNEDLIFTVEAERLPAGEPVVMMETSTGDVRPYRRYGRVTFTIEGQQAILTIYSDAHGQEFFLPFRDATSGSETYGAGRYLDNHRPGLEPLDNGQFRIDFNYAYNPYCAYSPDYSCPLPPRENWLTVPIRAGEKNFQPT